MTAAGADPRLGQLEAVRQRRQQDAMRVLQQRRAQVMAGLRQAEAAQQAVQAALAERAAFIEHLRRGASQGGVSVSGLLDAQGWQGAFDARIARANASLATVLDDVARRRAAFDEARRTLLRAQARLDGAHELAARERRALRAGAGRREDEAIDEAAARAWHAARHAARQA
ncbi:HrpD protein [Cupriavidus taiwanensis]|uniref:HrpD protein n=1 Tax=Cupriavidus taiwanensis TaxID=164546 RepID=A0A975XE23_9BURK|nr:flagellar FliJ family protein [Cupriavidus taiwanensis]SOY67308.1 HrpD protein [Cupriavidus taiwanensis]